MNEQVKKNDKSFRLPSHACPAHRSQRCEKTYLIAHGQNGTLIIYGDTWIIHGVARKNTVWCSNFFSATNMNYRSAFFSVYRAHMVHAY